MAFSDFDERRLAVCLGGLRDCDEATLARGPEPRVLVCGTSETKNSLRHRYGTIYPGNSLKWPYKAYIRQAQDLFRRAAPYSVFAIYPEDSRSRFAFPTLVKSRMVRDRDSGCVLLPLDQRRHWGDLPRIAAMDVPLGEKDNRLVWRGATTGAFKPWYAGMPYASRFYVASLSDDPNLDIGYSEIVQISPETSDLPVEALRPKLRPSLSIEQQLRSKFLLSLEGNDVATGLKWMLYSNSTVVMPRPTCETWACEGELVPYEHYVPVKDDLSDIREVYDWCLANLPACEEIAQNGKRFISRFLDRQNEDRLCRTIAAAYLNKVHLHLDFGLFERLAQRTVVPLDSAIRRARGKA
ncbi:hypothetical protein L0V05_06910 [Tabrizicola sp. J26]|uniref:glycosyl transferase family 90 n=1 Tax=Alitabrizicola rongguiensis TaxID=2909234 RepID=UPI001F460946|nr:glycosyl transferase family 90 [Tabrizicola rongguiensis]MCF1708544.1 hypothetical protein [Tabrizicola rongguiensis]